MTVLYASAIANRCILLTLNEEVNSKYRQISIENQIYPFNCVYDARSSISIPIGDYDPSELIGKKAEYVA